MYQINYNKDSFLFKRVSFSYFEDCLNKAKILHLIVVLIVIFEYLLVIVIY